MMKARCQSKDRRAFTLVEMLVTISVLALLVAILIPALDVFDDITRDGSGVNTISAAVLSARTYATQQVGSITDVNPLVAGNQTADFSGAAILFTPANELRLVQNFLYATSTSGAVLESTRNAYSDVADRDYLQLPGTLGFAGISRNASGLGGLTFFPPPFAVRFDENGQLIAGVGSGTSRVVYYDANYDGAFRISGSGAGTGTGFDRNEPYGGGSYDVDEWNPRTSEWAGADDTSDTPGRNPVVEKYKLPFEEIETVIGVVVYNREDFLGDGRDWPDPGSTGQGCGVEDITPCASNDQWLQENGVKVFFSRYSGTVVTDRRSDSKQ